MSSAPRPPSGRPGWSDGAVVVVSGASRGIGAATAELLARRGAHVVCTGRDREALERVAARCGGSAVVVDARDVASGERAVEAALGRHGRLDGVVVNAGVGHLGPFAGMAPELVAELVDVNVRGALLLARAGAAALAGRPAEGPVSLGSPRRTGSPSDDEQPVARPGGIVFLSSIAGAVGVEGEAVYSATKAALEAFAPLLREELAPSGVRVATVLPGVVDTGFFATRGGAYDRRVPRPVPPERIARAVVRALETGTPRQVVPRWLAFPAWLSAAAPGPYRALARRLS